MDYSMILASRRSVPSLMVLAVALGCGSSPTPSGDEGESSTSVGSSTTGPTATDPTTNPTTSPTTSPTTTDSTADTTVGSLGTTEDPPDTTTGSETGSSGGSAGTTEGSTTGSTSDASTDTGSTGGNALPDIDGDFLMAVATVIDPSLPLQYIATFDITPVGMGGTVDVDLQPLALDQGSTTVPRTPFGVPMSFPGLPVAPDGTFSIPIGPLPVPGETNPITGSDVQADMVLIDATIIDEDNVCGTMSGDLVSPIMISLSGTTMGSVRVADTSPAGLPVVFPVACP
jgi:hypothetical protein